MSGTSAPVDVVSTALCGFYAMLRRVVFAVALAAFGLALFTAPVGLGWPLIALLGFQDGSLGTAAFGVVMTVAWVLAVLGLYVDGRGET